MGAYPLCKLGLLSLDSAVYVSMYTPICMYVYLLIDCVYAFLYTLIYTFKHFYRYLSAFSSVVNEIHLLSKSNAYSKYLVENVVALGI